MPVTKEASGRRSVQAEVEVKGTPEAVWQAIASGPGISSWFVPTTLDGRVGGTTTSNFGPGMESFATITEWNPPHRFAAEAPDGAEGPGKVATEWIVEAKEGGTCTVRVVNSWFASTDDWDQQFEGHSFGWIASFAILQRYLAHFSGEACVPVQLSAMSMESVPAAWSRLVGPLGLANVAVGDRVTAAAGEPPLGGVVEVVNPPEWPGLLLRLDTPAPALAHLFALPLGGPGMVPLRFYLYGPAGAAAAPAVTATWQAWLDRQFGTPAG